MNKVFREHSLVAWLSLGSVLFSAGACVWVYAALNQAHGPLILHFNDNDGITQVGSLADLLNIGLTILILVGINTALALRFNERDEVWGKIIAGATLFLAILLFIAFAAIISVN